MIETFIFIDVSFTSGAPTHLFNSLFLEFGQISKDSCPHTFCPCTALEGGGEGALSHSKVSHLCFKY